MIVRLLRTPTAPPRPHGQRGEQATNRAEKVCRVRTYCDKRQANAGDQAGLVVRHFLRDPSALPTIGKRSDELPATAFRTGFHWQGQSMLMRIRDLRLDVHLGVTEAERAVAQQVHVTVAYSVWTQPESDLVADTVDYRTIRDGLVASVSQPMCLIETLTQRLLDAVLKSDARIRHARVTVVKPTALRGTAGVECTAIARGADPDRREPLRHA